MVCHTSTDGALKAKLSSPTESVCRHAAAPPSYSRRPASKAVQHQAALTTTNGDNFSVPDLQQIDKNSEGKLDYTSDASELSRSLDQHCLDAVVTSRRGATNAINEHP